LLANSAKQLLKTTKDVETNYKNFFKKPKTKLLIMKLAGTYWSKKNMKPYQSESACMIENGRE
jgi:hypothetical protein